ncbi:NAD(P)-dependent dehydrogenase (short-subunit alcohol dehydrogenase family) [Herbihabitans rhizosphaerae]|uniref:NAD(P)-dependent dehydrogenase (Short-subunit alcohol dehydrogenase family) n=1 Tax=Herbihabitans rhizosphaerae TaxID=1872711 RepID=A0A4Q7L3N5_9PSEU|nr:SDR family oxidoreductase [Herbihabitans rhizosphaerae]RZS44209.1 NAD(P)-dependent dehydrogenase (short-subunit alcohol dehydrogenase family) [Herbihabitans rhizosphaerae]
MTTNTIALVTGANKGIGAEIASALTSRGMTVLGTARTPRNGEIQLDVTDQDSVDAAAKLVEERHGRLDVLINNAGIAEGWGVPIDTTDLDVVRKVFDTNVFGVARVTNAMIPLLRRSSAPRIVNMSSSVGSLAGAMDGELAQLPASGAYVPSKTALNSLTVQYAKHLRGDGVLVNAACPGYCATDLNGHRGHRTPAQGAEIAVRLATLADDGPTGGFFDDDGPVSW